MTRIVTTTTATSARRGSGRRSRWRCRRSSPRKAAAAQFGEKRRRLRFCCLPPFQEEGAAQPSTPREATRVISPPHHSASPANDDRKSAIVTIKRKSRFGDAPDLTPEEHQRRGEAADAMWRGLVGRATAKDGKSAAVSAEPSSPATKPAIVVTARKRRTRRSAPADGVAAVPQAGRARRRLKAATARRLPEAEADHQRRVIIIITIIIIAVRDNWDRFGKPRDRPKHAPRRTLPLQLCRYIAVDLSIRTIPDKMRYDGCGGRAGKAELLTGIEGVSSRPVRRIVLMG